MFPTPTCPRVRRRMDRAVKAEFSGAAGFHALRFEPILSAAYEARTLTSSRERPRISSDDRAAAGGEVAANGCG